MDLWHLVLYGFAASYAVSSLTSLMAAYRRQLIEEQKQRERNLQAPEPAGSKEVDPRPTSSSAAA
jgi:hypothetical protein